jgi:hypothetical protein
LLLVVGGAFALGARRPGEVEPRPAISALASAAPPPLGEPAGVAGSAPALASAPAPASAAASAPAPASAAASAAPAKVPGKKAVDCSDVRVTLPNGRISYRRECLNR